MSSSADKLARDVVAIERKVRALSTAQQLAHSSIEDGAIGEYDADGHLVSRIGRQHDGTHGVGYLDGPVPPVPTTPQLIVVPGGLVVRYPGGFVGDVAAPMDLDRIDVHVSTTSGFTATAATLAATMRSPAGELLFLSLPPEPHHVRLRSRSLPGRESAATPQVSATPLPPVQGENLLTDPGMVAEAAWSNLAPGGDVTWGGEGSGRNGLGSVLIPAAVVHDGTYLGVDDPIRWAARVMPGQWYRVTAWVRATATIPIGSARLHARVYDAANLATYAWATPATITNRTSLPANTWAEVTGIVQIPATAGRLLVMGMFKGAVADAAMRWSGPVLRPMTSKGLVVPGAIDAEALTARLVLASEIIANDPNGSHVSLSPTGLYGYRPPASRYGPPEEAFRLGTSGDDVLGVTAAGGGLAVSIDAAGRISARTIELTDGLTIGGESVTDLVGTGGEGQKARGEVSVSRTGVTATMGLVEVAQAVAADRAYRVEWEMVVRTEVADAEVIVTLRYADNGATPTTTSPAARTWYFTPGPAGRYVTLNGVFSSRPGFDGSRRWLLCVARGAGTGVVDVLDAQSTTLHAYDEGSLEVNSGVMSTGGGTSGGSGGSTGGTSVRRHAPWIPARWAGSYLGSNGTDAWANGQGRAYQGLTPYSSSSGVQRSLIGFDSLATLLSGATVEAIHVYLYFEHWHYHDGGTAVLGIHGHGAAPATFSHSVNSAAQSASWPKPGGRWVAIPSAYHAGFKSGLYRGVSLYADSTDPRYYGYARASASLIRPTYLK